MNWATELVKTISGLELSPNYSYVFLSFVIFTIGFIVWAFYFAIYRKGLQELSNVSWLSLKDTVTYTVLTVVVIIIFSSLLFVYDFFLDKLITIIIEYANK